jgi:hypothetical protein
MDEMSLLREALKQQTIEKGENWLKNLEQDLNSLGMGDVWRRGGENNNNVWKVFSKRCTDTERQKMEANVKEKRSLALYNELKSSWEREKYRHLHIWGKKRYWMVEDGHLEAEGDEGKH